MHTRRMHIAHALASHLYGLARAEYGRQFFAGTGNNGRISFANTDTSPLYSGPNGNGAGYRNSLTMNSIVANPEEGTNFWVLSDAGAMNDIKAAIESSTCPILPPSPPPPAHTHDPHSHDPHAHGKRPALKRAARFSAQPPIHCICHSMRATPYVSRDSHGFVLISLDLFACRSAFAQSPRALTTRAFASFTRSGKRTQSTRSFVVDPSSSL